MVAPSELPGNRGTTTERGGVKKQPMILRRPVIVAKGGKLVAEIEELEVRLMAQADGYAMVRRKGCAPFVVMVKQLREKDAHAPA